MSSTPTPPTSPLDSSFTDREAEELIDVDRVLGSLAHPHRRAILGLLDEEPEWTREQLARSMVAVRETPGVRSEEQAETALLHKHLPKLERAELVSFDRDAGLVGRGERYGIVREMVEAAASVTAET